MNALLERKFKHLRLSDSSSDGAGDKYEPEQRSEAEESKRTTWV